MDGITLMQLPTRHLRDLGLAVSFTVVALVPATTHALETDQYLAWEIELADSAEPLNEFVNAEIEKRLARINRRSGAERSCESLTPDLLKSLFRTTSLPSRLRRFLRNDPSIERFPGSDTGYWGYLGDSLFRSPHFPFVLPMARTIRVGDVYTGTDKIGHIFGFGRRYYKRYRKALAQGDDEQQALRRVVRWGVNVERYLAGGILDGVFSYADLEANYQGLLLALAMCEGDEPHLARDERGWRLVHPIDIGRYVTPHLDESYYNSHFSVQRWKSIRTILEGYCAALQSATVSRRRAEYERRYPPSPAMRIVAEIFARRGDDRQRQHSIEAVCPERLPLVADSH